jgi:hypothetical protein
MKQEKENPNDQPMGPVWDAGIDSLSISDMTEPQSEREVYLVDFYRRSVRVALEPSGGVLVTGTYRKYPEIMIGGLYKDGKLAMGTIGCLMDTELLGNCLIGCMVSQGATYHRENDLMLTPYFEVESKGFMHENDQNIAVFNRDGEGGFDVELADGTPFITVVKRARTCLYAGLYPLELYPVNFLSCLEPISRITQILTHDIRTQSEAISLLPHMRLIRSELYGEPSQRPFSDPPDRMIN